MADQQTSALEALRADARRLDLAERDAHAVLLRAIHEHPPTREAYERWQRARERHQAAAARLDVFEAASRARKR